MSSADLVNNANGGGSPFACKLATCAVTRTNLFGKRKTELLWAGGSSEWQDRPGSMSLLLSSDVLNMRMGGARAEGAREGARRTSGKVASALGWGRGRRGAEGWERRGSWRGGRLERGRDGREPWKFESAGDELARHALGRQFLQVSFYI